jgi:trehalose 6-phosphate phosphatase/alpha,alpha-trehalase
MKEAHRPLYFFQKDCGCNRFSEIKPVNGIALFLDFDGTLVPIRKDPLRCYLSENTKKQLQLLAGSGRCRISILSGRALSDISGRVGIRGIYYGGNHGFDISGPGIRYTHRKAIMARQVLARAKRRLNKEIASVRGAWLEDKKFSLSLHYRSARNEDIPLIKRIFFRTVSDFLEEKSLFLIRGKKVLELIPAASWDKGRALLWILRRLKGRRFFPIYVGDDRTDETAFSSLHGKGITIRVGRSNKTSADYYLKGQGEISRLLRSIVGIMTPSVEAGGRTRRR